MVLIIDILFIYLMKEKIEYVKMLNILHIIFYIMMNIICLLEKNEDEFEIDDVVEIANKELMFLKCNENY